MQIFLHVWNPHFCRPCFGRLGVCVCVCVCVCACSVYLQITHTRESPLTSYVIWKFDDIASFAWLSSVKKFRLTYPYVNRNSGQISGLCSFRVLQTVEG